MDQLSDNDKNTTVSITNPRDCYDDLIERREENRVGAEKFKALEETEAFRAGWVVSAVVIDSTERILLAYHGGDSAWLAPGGSVQPGESLRQAVVREVREETGVTVSPNRPRAIVEHIARHDGESRKFRHVMYSAQPESTVIGDDLGEPGEPIEAVDWFENLPVNVFEKSLVEQVLSRL